MRILLHGIARHAQCCVHSCSWLTIYIFSPMGAFRELTLYTWCDLPTAVATKKLSPLAYTRSGTSLQQNPRARYGANIRLLGEGSAILSPHYATDFVSVWLDRPKKRPSASLACWAARLWALWSSEPDNPSAPSAFVREAR